MKRAQKVLCEYLARHHLKRSSQRNTVLRVFLSTHDRISIQQLHHCVTQQEPRISYTTVYRALALFVRCGLAAKVECLAGIALFGHRFSQPNRYTLACTACGDLQEFFSPEIESIGHNIGKMFRYMPTLQSFQIYGMCERCREKSSWTEATDSIGETSIGV